MAQEGHSKQSWPDDGANAPNISRGGAGGAQQAELAGRMQDMAEMIVEQARMMPAERGVALTCNGARIAKVQLNDGFGLEVLLCRDAESAERIIGVSVYLE